ncbi:MAG: flagellar FliJ family protein [Alphaproteobacteria bacterium]|nr:flagellar FliJ family protein [Alphaproteobacteria bacterium]
MKTRETLIRLHQFRVDEARRKLAGLEAMKADLERKARDLETTVASEQRRAIEDEIGRFAYPGFARSVLQRRDNLSKTIEEIARQIEAAHEDLNEAFRELKKYEVADETIKRNQAQERKLREQAESDDITLTRFAGRQIAERG